MPLPQEVINQLGEERLSAPGWSSGLLWFAFGLTALMVLLYVGIAFGYVSYVNAQITKVSAEAATVDQSVASDSATSLISLYSQTIHAQSLIQGHVLFSRFLTWLGNHTEANTYDTSLSFAAGNQITLGVLAKSEADINQQIAIFESDPEVQNVAVSNISLAPVSGYWQTDLTLTMNPAVFMATNQ